MGGRGTAACTLVQSDNLDLTMAKSFLSPRSCAMNCFSLNR